MSDGPIINHDPKEGRKVPDWHADLRNGGAPRKPSKADDMWYLIPLVFLMLAFLWLWFFVYETPNWVSVGMGAITGMMLTAWLGDKYGNKPFRDLLSDDEPADRH